MRGKGCGADCVRAAPPLPTPFGGLIKGRAPECPPRSDMRAYLFYKAKTYEYGLVDFGHGFVRQFAYALL